MKKRQVFILGGVHAGAATASQLFEIEGQMLAQNFPTNHRVNVFNPHGIRFSV